jgi:Tfp pilus assembly protein PilE
MKSTGFPSPSARRQGFTALEVAAVAAIIALMAVILIPILRTRVEDSKKVAAQDDMVAIEKAETLAYADTGHYVRLQDLTRPMANSSTGTSYPSYSPDQVAHVPHAAWNRELKPGFPSYNAASTTDYGGTELMAMVRDWKGSQLAVHRSASITTLINQAPWLFSNGTEAPSSASTSGGPILVLGANAADDIAILTAAKLGGPANAAGPIISYPVDPWGNPYIFFGSGKVRDPQVSQALRGLQPADADLKHNASATETGQIDYGTAAVYCLGPDGLPGTLTGAAAQTSINYYRELGYLGYAGPNSDDLSREF